MTSAELSGRGVRKGAGSMKPVKQWMDIMRNLTMLSQLGLSFITPLLMCLGACWLLQSKAGVGAWVYIPGFFFGLGSSGMVAWKLYLSVLKKEEKKEKKKGAAFNGHA